MTGSADAGSAFAVYVAWSASASCSVCAAVSGPSCVVDWSAAIPNRSSEPFDRSSATICCRVYGECGLAMTYDFMILFGPIGSGGAAACAAGATATVTAKAVNSVKAR